jgi:hypothetical protein
VSHEAARLYISLMTQVDDYGRYDGRNSVLWSDAFAVWNEQNPTKHVSAEASDLLCRELQVAKLVFFYEHNGRRYCVMNQWLERARGLSKWPPPPKEIEKELEVNRTNPQDFDSIPQESAAERFKILPPSPSPSPLAIAIYEAYPRKVGRPAALNKIVKAMGKINHAELLIRTQAYASAVAEWPESEKIFIPHPATWFNQERYNDDPVTWKRNENTKHSTSVRDGRIDPKFSQAGAYANAARTE